MANFDYKGNVKCVNNNKSWIELSFINYTGVLQDDIESISVAGPGGLITDDIEEFVIYEDEKYLFYQVEGVPEIGSYAFSVTIGGETVEDTDEQLVNRDIPSADTDAMTPSEGSSVPPGTVMFTWEAVPDPGYAIYYGIQIRDFNGDYLVNERYVEGFQYNVELSSGTYSWQVITMDGNSWVTTNNRSHGNWINFSVE